MINYRIWAALPVVLLAACSDRHPTWGGRILDMDGVLRVENPAEPLAEPGQVTYALLWSQPGPASGDVWEFPNRIHVFRGQVLVVDRSANRVHRVAGDGALLPSIGEAGSGPGQYRRIIDAIPTEAGLFVVDGGNGRVEILSDSGEIRGSFPLDRVVYSAAPLGTDAVLLFGLLGSGPGWTKLDAAGGREPVLFPDFDTPDNPTGPISSASAWNERRVRLRYTSPEIRIYSAAGVLEREIVIPLPVEVAADAEIERVIRDASSALLRDGLPSEVVEQAAAAIRAWPRDKLRFRKIEFDDGAGLAAIWEQNPEDFGSGNATLHLLTIDGVYLAKLAFDRPWADFDLADGVLFCLSRDPDTDLVTLRAHDLGVPGNLMDHARSLTAEATAQQQGTRSRLP